MVYLDISIEMNFVSDFMLNLRYHKLIIKMSSKISILMWKLLFIFRFDINNVKGYKLNITYKITQSAYVCTS